MENNERPSVKRSYKQYLHSECLDNMCSKKKQRMIRKHFTGLDEVLPEIFSEGLTTRSNETCSESVSSANNEGGPNPPNYLIDIQEVTDNDYSMEEFMQSELNTSENLTENEGEDFGVLKGYEHLLEMMFGDAGLSKFDVLTMVFGFCLKYQLTNQARKDLLEMMKLCANMLDDPSFLSSDHYMAKFFGPDDSTLQHVFYCKNCKAPLSDPLLKSEVKNQIISCKNSACSTEGKISWSVDEYFISIDVTEQISSILSSPGVLDALQQNRETHQNVIRDVSDGSVYIAAKEKLNFDLTYNYSIDGAAPFHSSKKSVWPLQLTINELPPKLRFRRLILAGVWTGNHEPDVHLMNTIMNNFSTQAKNLLRQGIDIKINDGPTVHFRLAPLLCSVDTVARPILQNRVQFNGYFGCSWCYEKGEPVNRQIKYPFEEVVLRTKESHMADLEEARAIRYVKPVRGVKGPASLLYLPFCDPVWSFPPDYMHGVLLGSVKQLWTIWTTYSVENKFTFYIGSPMHQKQINDRLINIKPPHEIHRLPRSVNECSKWKASEWRSWLLFYAIPCLKGILPEKYLKHFALLVTSIHALLKTTITAESLENVNKNLMRFVRKYQKYYHLQSMTFNVHSLIHLVESVKRTGPLWATSTFPFESRIYHIKQQINAPKGVSKQISKKMYNVNTFCMSVEANKLLMENAKTFCINLYLQDKLHYTHESNNVLFLGQGSMLSETQKLIMPENNINALSYTRCIYNKILLHSAEYQRSKRNEDSYVELHSGHIVRIHNFISISDESYMYVEDIRCSKMHVGTVLFDDILTIDRSQKMPEYLVLVNQVTRKCIYISIGANEYICFMPNIFEAQ